MSKCAGCRLTRGGSQFESSLRTLDSCRRGGIIRLKIMQDSVRLDPLHISPATSEQIVLCIHDLQSFAYVFLSIKMGRNEAAQDASKNLSCPRHTTLDAESRKQT